MSQFLDIEIRSSDPLIQEIVDANRESLDNLIEHVVQLELRKKYFDETIKWSPTEDTLLISKDSKRIYERLSAWINSDYKCSVCLAAFLIISSLTKRDEISAKEIEYTIVEIGAFEEFRENGSVLTMVNQMTTRGYNPSFGIFITTSMTRIKKRNSYYSGIKKSVKLNPVYATYINEIKKDLIKRYKTYNWKQAYKKAMDRIHSEYEKF